MVTPLNHWKGEGADDFERELLAVGTRERPSPGARRRAIAFLHGAAATTAATSMAAAATGTSATTTGLTVATLTQWTVGGLCAGLVAVAAGHAAIAMRSPTPAPSSRPAAAVAAPVSATREVRLTSPSASAAPSATEAAPPSPREPAQTEASPTSSSDLSAELAELEAARAALARGDLDASSRHLAAHAALPHQELGPEAQILDLEILLARGERGLAAARARAFLATSPSSPHAARVAALLARAGDDSVIVPPSSGDGTDEEAQ